MVIGTDETAQADALFHALADPPRRDILSVVLREPHSVSDLAIVGLDPRIRASGRTIG